MATLTIVPCPACDLPAEVFHRLGEPGEEEQVTTHCVVGHSLTLPSRMLRDEMGRKADPPPTPARTVLEKALDSPWVRPGLGFVAGSVVTAGVVEPPLGLAILLVVVSLALALLTGNSLARRLIRREG